VHPLVRQHKEQWLQRGAQRAEPLLVLDIPLLYETEGDRDCDAVVLVSAPEQVQRDRVLQRPGMTPGAWGKQG
jgi:dephospho-CoA kinase